MSSDPYGIDHRYLDANGEERDSDPDAIRVLQARIGRPPADRPPVPLVLRPGAEVPAGTLELEDGGSCEVGGVLPPDVPLGYHRLVDRAGGGRPLILGPGRAHLPARLRNWGWAVQLYAMRSARSWGTGDLADLRRLAHWSAQDLGAGFLLVNPLAAPAPTFPQQPSPYYPASRRFRSPLYLAVEEVPGAGEVADVAQLARVGRVLSSRREIDRDEVWRLKLAALESVWARRRSVPDEDFDAWVRAGGRSLREFATWCALAEEHGSGWHSWPQQFRNPESPAVTEFAAARADRVRFHAWLQFLIGRQVDSAAGELRIIQDLPIGVDPQGADAWAWQDLLAPGVSVGAPPDRFNSLGQDWGLPPFVPWRLVDAGYQPFVETVRASMAAGGGLRIDHVMGLFRLWWIPDGADPSAGAYVRYPAEDLLEIVALESVRAGALVVGEDLGTVEPGVREAMAEHQVLSYRVLWFEEEDPAQWPDASMAAVTTHDLPTVAGLWSGSDLAEQRKLDLAPNEEGTAAIRHRLATAAGLPEGASAADAVRAAYGLLARAPSALLTASLDDAFAEPDRPNMPGADAQRANWALALPGTLEDLQRSPLARDIATTLRDATTVPAS